MTFEEKIKKLEELYKELQNPETPLEKAVSVYEEAMKLSKEADEELSKLERRVEIVTGVDENGVTTEPF